MTTTAPAPSRKSHRIRNLWVIIATMAGLVAASTTTNLVIEHAERSSITPYGERVPVSHGALNVYRTAGGRGPGATGAGAAGPGAGKTIVLLSGLGTAAPALDFAPLIRELVGYNVVVVEGFGYGYSDLSAKEGTVENITAELHEALSKVNVGGPYILAGHSIAGFYTLYYANKYRTEVSAVVGIDPTIPAAGAAHPDAGAAPDGVNWGRLFSTTGLVRWASTLAPALVEPDGDAYTAAEREQMRRMTSWNFGNPAVVDEINRIAENAHKVQGLRYPDDLPVLTFLAGDEGTPPNRALHEDRLRNVGHHAVVVLSGGHYLHWTQAPAMAQKITAFFSQIPQ
ncbi:alpha/beta fold hydrolase [Pseudarthrobacter sp. ATCC 49987]|uniref:alpha/beta fold hydrolase n=1 Tax=Pseudarthrobacter sp. ATCC 49987 TaxID=2698204 RepID=UPI001368B225|nr:alpha/beta hydrolase [Pseudarthrobacter sp. ATCC 49987]